MVRNIGITLTFICLCLFSCLGLRGQTPSAYDFKGTIKKTKLESEYRNIISISPAFLYTFSIIDVKYERKITPLFSLAFNPTYYKTDRDIYTTKYDEYGYSYPSPENVSVSSLNLWFQGRFYLSSQHDAPRGFFIAPEVSIGLLHMDSENTIKKYNSLSFNTGIVLGYQWIVKQRFAIDLFLGATKYYLINNEAEKKLKEAYGYGQNSELILPSWGFSLGYFF